MLTNLLVDGLSEDTVVRHDSLKLLNPAFLLHTTFVARIPSLINFKQPSYGATISPPDWVRTQSALRSHRFHSLKCRIRHNTHRFISLINSWDELRSPKETSVAFSPTSPTTRGEINVHFILFYFILSEMVGLNKYFLFCVWEWKGRDWVGLIVQCVHKPRWQH